MENNLMNNQHHSTDKIERLSNKELDWLFLRLSPDELRKLSDKTENCWKELAPLKSVPFFTGLMGATYLIRLRFPNSWIGRGRPVLFYMATGFLSLISSQLYVLRCCAEKNQNFLNDLFKKHNGDFFVRKSRQVYFDDVRTNEDVSDSQFDESTPTISSNFEEMEEPTIRSKNE